MLYKILFRPEPKILVYFHWRFVLNFDKLQRIGESNIMNNGILATITYYENSTNLTIQWNDDKSFQKIKSYAHFKEGKIAKTCDCSKSIKAQRIGTTLIMNNGMKCTCITYRSCKDCSSQHQQTS